MNAFAMSAAHFRAAVWRELDSVQEVRLGGRPALLGRCPHCDRLVLVHEIEVSEEDNARAILAVRDHLRSCAGPFGRTEAPKP